jgi:hypothetical protein
MNKVFSMEQSDNTHSLNERAEGDLKLIRSMMQRSSLIIPMPGWGFFAVGLVGTSAALVTRSMQDMGWIFAWGLAAVLALSIAILTSTWQLRKTGRSIFIGSHSRFWLSLAPAFLAAGLLSVIFVNLGQQPLLAGLWLLLYGVALVAAGQHSVKQVTWMGCGFIILGAVFLFLPWPNLAMGLGFGGIHLLFGLLISRAEFD